jgi:hypothetical protein
MVNQTPREVHVEHPQSLRLSERSRLWHISYDYRSKMTIIREIDSDKVIVTVELLCWYMFGRKPYLINILLLLHFHHLRSSELYTRSLSHASRM